MRRVISHPIAFFVLVAAASLDWFVMPVGAEGDAARETPTPTTPAIELVPRSASEAEVGSIAIESRMLGHEVLLTFRNRGATDQRVEWDVDCVEVTGSPLSRMGPRQVVRRTERIELELAAHGQTTHRIDLRTEAADGGPAQATTRPQAMGAVVSDRQNVSEAPPQAANVAAMITRSTLLRFRVSGDGQEVVAVVSPAA